MQAAAPPPPKPDAIPGWQGPGSAEPEVDPRPVRSSAVRANVATVMLGVIGPVLAFSAVHDFSGASLLQNIYTTSNSELIAFDSTATTIGIVYLLLLAVTAIAFVAWLSRAIENVPRMGAGRPAVSPRWSIGWWFIPFANFVMPFRAVRDLDRRMRLPDGGGAPVGWWWAVYLAYTLPSSLVGAYETDDIGALTTAFQLSAIFDLVGVVAAVLAILVVRRIQGNADRRAGLAVQAPFWSGVPTEPSPAP